MKKWVMGIVLVYVMMWVVTGIVAAQTPSSTTTVSVSQSGNAWVIISTTTTTDSTGATTVTSSSSSVSSSGVVGDGGVTLDPATNTILGVGAGGASAASIDAAVAAALNQASGGGSTGFGGTVTPAAGTTGAHYGTGEISGFYRWPPDSGNYYPIQVGTVTGGAGVDSITLIPAYCPTEDMVADFDGELEFNGCCRWRPNGTVRVCHEGSRVKKGTCSYDSFLASEKVAKYCKVVCPPGTVYTPKYSTFAISGGCTAGSCSGIFNTITKACKENASGQSQVYCYHSPCVTLDQCNSEKGMSLGTGTCTGGKIMCKPPTCMTESACKYQTYGTISYPDIGAIVGAQCGTVSAPKVMCIKPDAGYTCESCTAVAPSAPSCGSVDVVGNNVTLNWIPATKFGKACGIMF